MIPTGSNSQGWATPWMWPGRPKGPEEHAEARPASPQSGYTPSGLEAAAGRYKRRS